VQAKKGAIGLLKPGKRKRAVDSGGNLYEFLRYEPKNDGRIRGR
jgi:hypothetical protein